MVPDQDTLAQLLPHFSNVEILATLLIGYIFTLHLRRIYKDQQRFELNSWDMGFLIILNGLIIYFISTFIVFPFFAIKPEFLLEKPRLTVFVLAGLIAFINLTTIFRLEKSLLRHLTFLGNSDRDKAIKFVFIMLIFPFLYAIGSTAFIVALEYIHPGLQFVNSPEIKSMEAAVFALSFMSGTLIVSFKELFLSATNNYFFRITPEYSFIIRRIRGEDW